MAEGVKETYTNIFLSLAIVFCLISFAYVFEIANHVPSENSIANSVVFKSLNDSVGNLINTEIPNQQSEINASSVSSSSISFGWIIWNGIIGFGKTIISLPIAVFQGMKDAFGVAFGTVIYVIFNIIGLIITVQVIVLLVRFWRQGQ